MSRKSNVQKKEECIDEWKLKAADYIQKNGKSRKGRTQLIKFYRGEYLSQTDAILAHCYDCMGYYEGETLCSNTTCPLHNAYLRAMNK